MPSSAADVPAAGAVAARCYAIAKLNNVTNLSFFDICATTSCQVYNPARINLTYTDPAVYYTDNWVVLNSAGVIPSTEYSAENNSIGYSCGDSWTQPTGGCIFDPVCAGEVRYGHGRGMCQWGSSTHILPVCFIRPASAPASGPLPQ